MNLGRREKIAVIVCALVAVQVGVLLGYRTAHNPRTGPRPFVAEAVPPTKAPLLLVDLRGTKQPLAFPNAPTVVHFWATWCKPCREELPELLALAADERLGVEVIAVSVDETWDVIDHYFDGRTPPIVTRAAHDDVRAAFGMEALPTSFLVDATGAMRFRLPGAQPWSSAAAREWLAGRARGRERGGRTD